MWKIIVGLLKNYINCKGNEGWSHPELSSWPSFIFAIYINDLPINIQGGQTTLFADYTNIQIETTNVNTVS
jgi:hypothetical protein